MKKLFFTIMCVFFTNTLLGQSQVIISDSTNLQIKPILRERHIEKRGDYYVIITETTITEEDYKKLKIITRKNKKSYGLSRL